MLKILAALCLSLIVLGTPPAVATEAFSGGESLKGWCDNMDDRDLHWGLCVGSIISAHDTIMAYQNFENMEQLVCIAPEVTRGEVVAAVIDYMNMHPEDLDYSLGDLVLVALIARYPCTP